jgi:cytoskeletal protein CcmA (bactofilin family)
MWGRKDQPEEHPQPTNSAPQATAPEAVRAPTPARAPEPERHAAPRGASHFGKTLKLVGTIAGNEDLYIDGEVEGKITLENCSLTVGPNGNVQADVKAKSVAILGRVKGNVHVGDRTEIRNTGTLEGDLVTARVIIEEEAVFRGSIDIVKNKAERAEAEIGKRPVASESAPKPKPQFVAEAGAARAGQAN